MIYVINVYPNYNPRFGKRVYQFRVEWDNHLDNLIEFLKSSGYQTEYFSIEEFPILKFSEFRERILDIENLRENMYNI